MTENKHVLVQIMYGDDSHMQAISDTPIMPENVPAISRLLMDRLYLRLDDQVTTAKLRAHRRRLRDKHRERAVGQVLTTQTVKEKIIRADPNATELDNDKTKIVSAIIGK